MIRSGTVAKSVYKLAAVLFALALILLSGIACASGEKVAGAWHNQTYAQILNFKDNGSCSLKTADGIIDGLFVFNQKSGEGTMMLLGQTMTFTVKGDVLNLVDNQGIKAEFKRGDMAIAMVTPVSTPVQTMTSAPLPTATSQGTVPPLSTLNPGLVVKPGDVIGKFINNTEIVGIWYSRNVSGAVLNYNADYSFRLKFVTITYGTYTYDKVTNKGVMTENETGITRAFTYDEVLKEIRIVYGDAIILLRRPI